jgi:tetratricopeptide (TPR) repeat protein
MAESQDWLLVVDDIRDDVEYSRLLPQPGPTSHILLTSREAELPDSHQATPPAPRETEPQGLPATGEAGLAAAREAGPSGEGAGAVARAMEVPPFTPDESRRLLLAELPQMPSAPADQIGWTVGNVPLAVSLAGRLLTIGVAAAVAENMSYDAGLSRAVQRFSDDYRDARGRLLAADAEVTAARIALEVALATVVEDPDLGAWQSELDGWGAAGRGGAVEWILDAFALLTTKGVSMELLRSPGMQRRLTEHLGAGEPLPLSDALMIDLTVWRLARHGLLEVDLYRTTRPVRQHATLRELTLRRMSAERRATLTRELWVALREYVPGRPIGPKPPDPEVWQNLVELRTWEMPGRDLRRWFMYRVYDLVQAGDKPSLDLALEVGERARALWAQDSPSSPEYLRLLSLLAQAYRTLGDFERARTLAKQALREQRRVLGHDHPRTLLSADAHAAILRATGDFGEALVECRAVAGRLASLLGPDHYATIQAEHNLALSESLSGNAREALRIAADRFERGRAIVGDTPGVWLFAVAAARYHRALGEPAKSYALLKDLLAHAGSPGFTPDLARSAESGLAVSERMLGLADSALERDTRLLGEFIRHKGARSLPALACRSSLAADLIAIGKHGEALTEAEACLGMFVTSMGDGHPFTQIPRMQVSICLRAAGELERARAEAESALSLLSERLEYPHPWVFSARVNLANVLVALGERDSAAEQETSAIQGLEEMNEPFHPARRTAVENLNDTQAPGGSRPGDRLDVDLEIPQV